MRLILWWVVVALPMTGGPAFAAPELTPQQQQILDASATDRDGDLDRQGPAMYVLLENAAGWAADDFTGDAGAPLAPTPDYAYLQAHPAELRGQVFLIEGAFVEQVRYPTPHRDGRDRLQRAGHPLWGDQLTGWGVRVGEGADTVVMVYFVDPNNAVQPPAPGQRVRVAARFYKVWSVPDREGRPTEFLTFVGGAREVVAGRPASVHRPGWHTAVFGLVLVLAGVFYGARLLRATKAKAGRARLESRPHRRGRDETDQNQGQEPIDPDLPDDPAEALAYLSRTGVTDEKGEGPRHRNKQ